MITDQQRKCDHDDIAWDFDGVSFDDDIALVTGTCKGCNIDMYMEYLASGKMREHKHSESLILKSKEFDCDALTVVYHCRICYRNITQWYYYNFTESEIERNGDDTEPQKMEAVAN